ncbi:hypothetical protein ACFSJY_02740 [Thalassotalea euphylliae]|uniref:hypothetical protein n=1 Tax=Thalassotalea euphylliae TaxID=1655234 RepID=UPI003625509E
MELSKPKIGTSGFPILLVPHTSDKAKNDKASRVLSNGNKAKKHEKKNNALYWPRKKILNTPYERSLDAIKNSKDYFEAFNLNIIKNPHLSALEIKLALYFYREELNCFGQLQYGLCYLIDHNQNTSTLNRLIGEDGWIYYKTDDIHFDDLKKDVIDLREELPKLNINDEISDVKQAIKNLQDWGYITLTPISWKFVHKRSARSVMPKDKSELTKEYAVNIRVFPLYAEKLVFKTPKPD